MIGSWVNKLLLTFYLAPLLNRVCGRRLTWQFRGPDKDGRRSTVKVGMVVDWGHTDAELWEWHYDVALAAVRDGAGNVHPGWYMVSCPPEITAMSGGTSRG